MAQGPSAGEPEEQGRSSKFGTEAPWSKSVAVILLLLMRC
jgi:hypothetical protein